MEWLEILLPGPHWTSRWLETNKDSLLTGYLTTIDAARKKADSAFYYGLYFELLEEKLKKYNIEPQNMYNMDEKGFLIRVLQKVKQVFSKKTFEAGRLKHVVQDGNRE
jgi:hypothetical protein